MGVVALENVRNDYDIPAMSLADAIEVRKVLGTRLLLVFAASIMLMFITVEGSPMLAKLCDVGACMPAKHASSWNKVSYDLALGAAVSIFFYWLLVRWPDHERRLRIKRSFAMQYRTFKISCVEMFVGLAEGSYDSSLPSRLLTPRAFREFFDEDLGNRDTRWYRVANKLDEFYLQLLVDRMEVFRDEIAFVLQNTDVQDEEALEFFKRFSRIIYAHKHVTPGYDDVKAFCGFMWSLFAGWDFVTGYKERDIVEEMIEAI